MTVSFEFLLDAAALGVRGSPANIGGSLLNSVASDPSPSQSMRPRQLLLQKARRGIRRASMCHAAVLTVSLLLAIVGPSYALARPEKKVIKHLLKCDATIQSEVIRFAKANWDCRAKTLKENLPDSATTACVDEIELRAERKVARKCNDEGTRVLFGDPTIGDTLGQFFYFADQRAAGLFSARFLLPAVPTDTRTRVAASASPSLRLLLKAGRKDRATAQEIASLYAKCRAQAMRLVRLGSGKGCNVGDTQARISRADAKYSEAIQRLGAVDLALRINRVLPFLIDNPTCEQQTFLRYYYEGAYSQFPALLAFLAKTMDGIVGLNDQIQLTAGVIAALASAGIKPDLVGATFTAHLLAYEVTFGADFISLWTPIITGCATGFATCAIAGLEAAFDALLDLVALFEISDTTQKLNELMLTEKYLSAFYQYGANHGLVAQSRGVTPSATIEDVIETYGWEPFSWKRPWRPGDYEVGRLLATIAAWRNTVESRTQEGCDPEPEIVGRWHGTVTQTPPGLGGGVYPMDVHVTSDAPGVCAQVDYPSLACGGRWECGPMSNAREIEATEILTYGKRRCVDRASVRLTLNADGSLSTWGWNGSGITAGASLGRDRDGDGFGATDCNDNDPEINPGAEDVCGDGVDSDCNGIDCGGSLMGQWQGRVTEDFGATYMMDVQVTWLGTGHCGVVDYPSLGCGGFWVCDQPSDASLLNATEVLVYGRFACVDRGSITLTLLPSRASANWAWTAPGRSATAVLGRSDVSSF